MKNYVSICSLSFLLLLFSSCKKESPISIVGKWRSVSVYTIQDSGNYKWVPIERYPQFLNFSNEGRFGSATDVPGGSGSYNYDETSQTLILHFEADAYGNVPGTRNLKVDELNRDKLILSYSLTGSNTAYKTEYTRLN